MSKTDAYEQESLATFFQGNAIADLPNPGFPFWVALFTADPGESGSTSAEAAYSGYARRPVLRQPDGNGWLVSGPSPSKATNIMPIEFPPCGSTGATLTHWALLSQRVGGRIFHYGALTAPIAISAGITPRIPAGGLEIQED